MDGSMDEPGERYLIVAVGFFTLAFNREVQEDKKEFCGRGEKARECFFG